MPSNRTEWARVVIQPDPDPVYHWVTFGPGPTLRHEATAACGLTARFWPKVGIRINDCHCHDCLAACADEWRT